MGMAGDDERDVEYIQHLIEHEVVTANLLGAYQPLVHYICTNGTSVRSGFCSDDFQAENSFCFVAAERTSAGMRDPSAVQVHVRVLVVLR